LRFSGSRPRLWRKRPRPGIGSGKIARKGCSMRRSDYIVLSSVGVALVASIYLWFSGQRDEGVFVGLWVPTILAFAIYVRVIKAIK
jgi:hypothetical protein